MTPENLLLELRDTKPYIVADLSMAVDFIKEYKNTPQCLNVECFADYLLSRDLAEVEL